MRFRSITCAALATFALLVHAAPSGSQSAPPLVHATSRTTWIYPGPRVSSQPLGYLRAGRALPARSERAEPGPGCRRGFIAVEPRGFVCLDRGSFGAPTRYGQALRDTLPGGGPLELGFGLSSGSPAFRRVPSPSEAATHRPSPPFAAGAARLELIHPAPPIRTQPRPWFLENEGSARAQRERELVRERIPPGSLIAYTRRFAAAGRDWLLRTDGSLVDAGQVRPLRRSTFRGVKLDGELRLPLFWLRDRDATRHVLEPGRAPSARGNWPRRSAVGLDPERRSVNWSGQRYLRTRESTPEGAPLYVRASEATVVEALRALPVDPGRDGKWIHFSISRGTLVAYEGKRAVFATLASPGLGGVPVPGDDHVRRSTTPLGTFRISVKHLADDMGGGESAGYAEVPYTQYFEMPFAIHVAYWHESFGQPMSGGCINVSPLDGRYLFDWTLPALPRGWDAVVAGGEHGVGTLVHIVP